MTDETQWFETVIAGMTSELSSAVEVLETAAANSNTHCLAFTTFIGFNYSG